MTCVCFVGAMMGRHPGHLTSQGLIVSEWLSATGRYGVISTSAVRNRYLRLMDIATTLIRRRRHIDIQCLEVYGGPSVVVEEIASALGKAAGHRIVMVLHGGALPAFIARYPRTMRRVLRRADVLVTPSKYLQRALAQVGFTTHVIPNTLDLAEYPFHQRRHVRPRLFWMRSFHPLWNPAMAVRVLARVRSSRPEATLALAGQDKGLESEIRRLAHELGVGAAVRFTGFLDHAGKLREAADADIFLNTNRIDNMPVAVVEACAMGLPVVSTDVGGIGDLLTQGETGLIVPDNDDEAMARAVLRLIDESDLAERLSVNGRRLAERSDWNAVLPQWERLFAQLADRPTMPLVAERAS